MLQIPNIQARCHWYGTGGKQLEKIREKLCKQPICRKLVLIFELNLLLSANRSWSEEEDIFVNTGLACNTVVVHCM